MRENAAAGRQQTDTGNDFAVGLIGLTGCCRNQRLTLPHSRAFNARQGALLEGGKRRGETESLQGQG